VPDVPDVPDVPHAPEVEIVRAPVTSLPTKYRVQRFQWLRILGRAAKTGRGGAGMVMMLFVIGVAVIGPFVASKSPTAFATIPFAHPSAADPLGGDTLGRDVLSRVLNGGWVLLVMAAAATAIGVITGIIAGVSAAYLRGWRDGLIMRTVDVVLAFPQLVFALLLVSVFGPKLWLIVIAVGVSHAPQVARVVRSATLEISERDYVKAVELWGVRPRRVMSREILPNIVSPLMVEIGLRLTYSIVIIAGLAFLGFGQAPPAPSWGYMITENLEGSSANLWTVAAPAILIALLTVGTNTFTDAVARVAIGVDRRPEDAAMIESVELGTRVA
jgi:peptide/nickel transport system permease protein